MALTLTLRGTKGSPLTATEHDQNLTNIKNIVDSIVDVTGALSATTLVLSSNATISGNIGVGTAPVSGNVHSQLNSATTWAGYFLNSLSSGASKGIYVKTQGTDADDVPFQVDASTSRILQVVGAGRVTIGNSDNVHGGQLELIKDETGTVYNFVAINKAAAGHDTALLIGSRDFGGSVGVANFLDSSNAANSGSKHLYISGSGGKTWFGGDVDVNGLIQCNSFRIDVSPTSETVICTHTITISVNGNNYKIPIVAA